MLLLLQLLQASPHPPPSPGRSRPLCPWRSEAGVHCPQGRGALLSNKRSQHEQTYTHKRTTTPRLMMLNALHAHRRPQLPLLERKSSTGADRFEFKLKKLAPPQTQHAAHAGWQRAVLTTTSTALFNKPTAQAPMCATLQHTSVHTHPHPSPEGPHSHLCTCTAA
jgi:hypothetical protein